MRPPAPSRARPTARKSIQGAGAVRAKRGSHTLPSFSEKAGDRQFATTLARGLEVLRCFTADDPLLGNKDLAERTGLPKATISRLAYTLTSLGYLRADYRLGKYQLGPALISMTYPLLANIAVRQIARSAMKNLADHARGSVSLGMRDRTSIVYVETSRSSAIVAHHMSDIGQTQPMIGSAIGRAYLSACPPSEREAILNEIKVKRPAEWKRFGPRVTEGLADYQRLGFCMMRNERRPDIHAVAVPFRRGPGGDIYAFNCVVHSYLLKPGELENDIGPRLAAMAKSLEV